MSRHGFAWRQIADMGGRKRVTTAGALAGVALGVSGLLVACTSSAGTQAVTSRSSGPNGQLVIGRFDPALGDTVLYTLNPDGSHLKKLLNRPFECPNWSPDGTRIATCGTPQGNGTSFINPETRHVRELRMPDRSLNITCPVWSPDGSRLACEGWSKHGNKANGIYTVRSSDGRDRQRLTANSVGGHDIPGGYSPNGKQLVFAREYHSGDGMGLFVARTDGSGTTRIAGAGMHVSSLGDWTAHGNLIVFSRHVTPQTHSSVWVVHPDGNGLRRIDMGGKQGFCGGALSDPSAHGCTGLHWSPDGKKLVFIRDTGGDHGNVYTANADGSHLRQVTRAGSEGWVDWGKHPLSR